MTLIPVKPAPVAPVQPVGGAADLFVWLDALWNKTRPDGTFPVFVAHRFLASDQALAYAACVLSEGVRDPAMAFATWQGLLPEECGAPRLTYPAAKKRPEAEQLTARVMKIAGVRRVVAEEMQALVDAAGRLDELYAEFGVERSDRAARVDEDERPTRKSKEQIGLMAMIKR